MNENEQNYVPNKSMEQVKSPEWLIDWKQNNDKQDLSPLRPILKTKGILKCANKPFSKESNRTDSTANESLASNSRAFNEKLRQLKSAKPFTINKDEHSMDIARIENSYDNQQKRCNSLSAKVKIKNTPMGQHYLSPEEIVPVDNPENEWEKCTEQIKCSADWLGQFETCNTIRRLCAHHTSVIVNTPALLHTFVLDLLKLVDSLRSSLSKNALLVFADLFVYCKRVLEPDLEFLVPPLLRKSTESGSFLGPHAADVLKKMCENCLESRVTGVLINSVAGGARTAPQVKLRAIHYLHIVIKKLGERLLTTKEGEKILTVLSNALSEGAIEIRNAAKEGIALANSLAGNPSEFDRLLKKVSSSNDSYKKALSALIKTGSQNFIAEDLIGPVVNRPSLQGNTHHHNSSNAFFQTIKNNRQRCTPKWACTPQKRVKTQ